MSLSNSSAAFIISKLKLESFISNNNYTFRIVNP